MLWLILWLKLCFKFIWSLLCHSHITVYVLHSVTYQFAICYLYHFRCYLFYISFWYLFSIHSNLSSCTVLLFAFKVYSDLLISPKCQVVSLYTFSYMTKMCVCLVIFRTYEKGKSLGKIIQLHPHSPKTHKKSYTQTYIPTLGLHYLLSWTRSSFPGQLQGCPR